MAPATVTTVVKRYLEVLREAGFRVKGAVVFGSRVRGAERPDSDIDVLVISPDFDTDRWSREAELWRLVAHADPRIEPIPVGERQFLEDRTSPIIAEARRHGEFIAA